MSNRLFVWLVAACCLFMVSAPSASTFQVSPTVAVVAPDQDLVSFTLRNPGAEPLSVQVDAVAWSQQGGEDVHVPASDLVLVPRIATVAPGKSQLVRVALRNAAREREHAYRIRFVELPGAPKPGFIGVRTVLRVDVPLFFTVAAQAGAIQWSTSLDAGGKLLVHASNPGSRFFRGQSVQIVDSRGALLAERTVPIYVLAGQQRAWPLTTHAELASGDSVTLRVEHDGQRDEHALTLQ